MKKISGTMIAVAICQLLQAGTAVACSCKESDRELWQSEQPIIFVSEILSTELTDEELYGFRVVTARYRVVEPLRGNPSTIKLIRTITGGASGSCGVVLLPGERYIFFTDKTGWVDICNRSNLLYRTPKSELAIEKLRQLRDGK